MGSAVPERGLLPKSISSHSNDLLYDAIKVKQCIQVFNYVCETVVEMTTAKLTDCTVDDFVKLDLCIDAALAAFITEL